MVKINTNTIQSAKTTANSIRQRESQYILLKKTEQLPIEKLNVDGKVWGYGVYPDSKYFTHVKVGRKNDSKYNREILTFYDKNNNMINRIFIGNNINKQSREYKYSMEYPKDYPNIPVAERKHIKVKEWFNNEGWKPIKEEDQFVYTMDSKSDKKPKKLQINSNVYDYSHDKVRINASMTEYPTTRGVESADAYKHAFVEMEMDNEIPKIKQIFNTTNVNISKDDKFLPYRFLLEEKKQISLAHEALKEEGIDNLGINVKISPSCVPKNSSGFFDSYFGNIWFRKILRKTHPIRLTAHEVDHAKRYAMIGRLGKRRSPFEQKAEEKLGLITDLNEQEKSYEYLIASENYPKLEPNENLRINKDYWDNELEVLARKKEDKKSKEYNIGRSQLLKQFKYIAGENTL